MHKVRYLMLLSLLSCKTFVMENQSNQSDADLSSIDRRVARMNRERGITPLHCAVSTECLKTVTDLIASGANPNSQNCDGETPLHILCLYDFGDPHKSTPSEIEKLSKKRFQIARALLNNGANPNIKTTKEGHNPLFYLIGFQIFYHSTDPLLSVPLLAQRKSLIKLLLHHNAQFLKNTNGKTCIQYAQTRQTQDPLELANFAEREAQRLKLLYLNLLYRPQIYLDKYKESRKQGTSPFTQLPLDIVKMIIDMVTPNCPWPKENYVQLVAKLKGKEPA